MNFRFIIEIKRFYETKRLEIHVRRNYPTRSGSAVIWFRLMFKILTSRIMKLLGWFTASWWGSGGAYAAAGLCRRWRPGRVAGHSPRSGPGSAGGSRPWTPAGSTPTRLSRHNMYLQSVIVKWQYFTFGSKLPVNLFPPETWCHWVWAGLLSPRRDTCQSSAARPGLSLSVPSTAGMTWYCRLLAPWIDIG